MAWGVPDVLLPEAVREAYPFLLPFGIIGLWRWALFTLRVVFWLCYRPIRPKKNQDGTSANKYKSSDVTIIVPTIDNGEEFKLAAKYWLLNDPHEVIIVTSDKMKAALEQACLELDALCKFRVLSVPKPNKRLQMVTGVNAATTDIVALSDDDAIWTESFLDWCLAPFDQDRMGGVGSKQVMIPVGDYPTFWEVIADFRLTMRMIETSASTFVDGGMSCLSGRTALYRRKILAEEEFQDAFTNETWLGKYGLHSGDDKFITRWLVTHDWNMQMQNHKDACLQTTFKPDSKFVKQVLRWTRNTWRSDFKSIFVEHAILWRFPYVAFNMFDKFINPLPLIWGLAVIVGNLCTNGPGTASYVVLPVVCWILLSRMLRLIPHLIKNPSHLPYVPAMVLFQYFFAFAKVYALFTLHITDWGSRPTVAKDEKGKATASIHTSASSSDLEDTAASSDSDSSRHGEDAAQNIVLARGNLSVANDVETASTPSSADDDTAIGARKQKSSVVPSYKRPAVILGSLALGGLLVCLVFLGLAASRHRLTYWEMTVVAQNKALSADRATGVGVYDAISDKTFIAYAGPNMDSIVKEYDHQEQRFTNVVNVARAKGAPDFHDYPKMVMADDGHLLVVRTEHTVSLDMAKSDMPHTSQATWTNHVINNDRPSYPCILKVSNGDIYIFYRSTKESVYRPMHYVKSIDHGNTWSDPVAAIDTGNEHPESLNEVYFGCPRLELAEENNPERLQFGWTLAGGAIHNEYHKDAHFAYFYPASDSFASVDGNNLGETINLEELPSTVVFDSGPLNDDQKRIVDYYFAPSYSLVDQSPMMVFNFNQTLMSARWAGIKWHYTTIDSDKAFTLFDLERTGPQSFRLFHSQGDIAIYTSENGGQSWKLEHRIVPRRGKVNKVVKIPDAHPDMSLIALENEWAEQDEEPTEVMNYQYTGFFQVWTLREVEYNPISSPRQIGTNVQD